MQGAGGAGGRGYREQWVPGAVGAVNPTPIRIRGPNPPSCPKPVLVGAGGAVRAERASPGEAELS